ncbi:minor capsid protein [Niallia sp. RD1]|uniref:minor capsid protein n=1 Tax=Niallia sp. RD1 TaxID=2962858 RepID=UPI0020C1A9DD|nr:minor capsid protein [Niallia sp. RD1]UTI41120.1 minor capsid protein [Niallia sp. RD1]
MAGIEFNTANISSRIRNTLEETQKILDVQVLKDSNYYAPQDTGELQRSGDRLTIPGSGKVIWETPYARRLYYGITFNFSKDKNANAGPLWFEQGKSTFLSDWVRIVQNDFNDRF